eukprot:547717-Prymnesium_polylepis.1
MLVEEAEYTKVQAKQVKRDAQLAAIKQKQKAKKPKFGPPVVPPTMAFEDTQIVAEHASDE